jgi:hypothetical protein
MKSSAVAAARLVLALGLLCLSLSASGLEPPLVADIARGSNDGGRFGSSLAVADVAGDHNAELLVGEPGFGSGLGRVRVYSNAGFFQHLSDIFSDGVSPRSEDRFGESVVAGEFDEAPGPDIAIGVPGRDYQDVGATDFHADAGWIEVQYSGGNHHIVCKSCSLQPGLSGVVHSGDQLGRVLAVGNFNGDAYDDLAIGVPLDGATAPFRDFGSVNIVEGSESGLMFATVPQEFQMVQGLAGLPDVAESFDEFGAALAAADFNKDGYDDLAIGVPGENGRGAVLMVLGSPNGLIFANHWYFDSSLVGFAPVAGDRFGAALASGDINVDGYADLLIGTPGADWTGSDTGAVTLLFGGDFGFNFAAARLLFNPTAQPDSGFGATIAAGDFDGNGADDVVVGSPHLDDQGHADVGGIHFFLGHPGSTFMTIGPTLLPYARNSQVPDMPRYGLSLASGRARHGASVILAGGGGWFLRGAVAWVDHPLVGLLSDGFE